MRAVCACLDRESAGKGPDRAASWTMRPNVPGMEAVAGAARKGREGILDRLSRNAADAVPEGPSSAIQSIRRAAGGSRNVERFKTMTFLRLGRLDFSARLAVSSATH
ncbi:MAG: transposase [Atopobiaceae bacterium]|jgi:transposase|nr:transposase [Atopobiaceae bacterium]